jgi:4-amino-4-deoxy-L-arabinose transferase-like glycosyltransferase
MASISQEHSIERHSTSGAGDRAILLLIAIAVAVLHMATNGRYGFHRDELQFLSDARHLDWGFVAFPPVTPFLERLGLAIFGVSLIGLRLFSVIAQSTAIVVTGLMACELGGRRLAQITAALTVALSPLPLFNATEFQYTSFDFLWWILIAYFTIRLLKSENPRWWLAIGAAVGIGLETKYSVMFLIAGILTGVVLSRARRYLVNPWFWAGIAVALLIFLPNFLWLVRHDFISYQFLQHIHRRDVGEGRAEGYLKNQLLLCINLFGAPLAIAGLIGLLRNARYRMLAWMFIIPFILFWIGKGRFYYMAAAYPMLLAMGSVIGERWLASRPRWSAATVEAVFFTGLAVMGAYASAVILPLATSGSLRAFALRHNGDLREEIGWNQLVKSVAQIRDSLPPGQQTHLGITTANYGEYGAIEILGRAYGLPEPIGTTNSEWFRGYPNPLPTTLIVLGLTRGQADSIFTGCRLAGHNGNSEGVVNEESQYHPDIFLCGPPQLPWPELWKRHRDFG